MSTKRESWSYPSVIHSEKIKIKKIMIHKSLKLASLFSLVLGLTFMFSSCEKGESNLTDDTIEYTTQAIFEIQERGGCGRGGCFEFVFPITIEFPDGTTAEAEDYDGLRTIISDWKEQNPDAEERPNLSFPLEILSEDGELITLDSAAELVRARRLCRRSFGNRPHHGRGERCFSLVYPITITFPDETTAIVDSRRELKVAVRAWKRNNRESEERPMLTYPLQVEMEDGTIVDVASKEDLQALKDSCSEEG